MRKFEAAFEADHLLLLGVVRLHVHQRRHGRLVAEGEFEQLLGHAVRCTDHLRATTTEAHHLLDVCPEVDPMSALDQDAVGPAFGVRQACDAFRIGACDDSGDRDRDSGGRASGDAGRLRAGVLGDQLASPRAQLREVDVRLSRLSLRLRHILVLGGATEGGQLAGGVDHRRDAEVLVDAHVSSPSDR